MLKTFSIGGVHPHENKLSAHQPIITAEVPAKAVILLGQHIGAPAKSIVAKGDMVKVGTKIAEPAGFVSAAIHSSVSGLPGYVHRRIHPPSLHNQSGPSEGQPPAPVLYFPQTQLLLHSRSSFYASRHILFSTHPDHQ